MKAKGVTAESSAQHRFWMDFLCYFQVTFEKYFKNATCVPYGRDLEQWSGY